MYKIFNSSFNVEVNKCIFCYTANKHKSKNESGKHIAKLCFLELHCEKCFSKQNVLICFKQGLESQLPNESKHNNETRQTQTKFKVDPVRKCNQTENSVLTCKCSLENLLKNSEILLQTFLAQITNKINVNSKKCAFLFLLEEIIHY